MLSTTILSLVLATPLQAPPAGPVAVRVESSIESKTPQIRQLAFDGDQDTYFESAKPAGRQDHLTFVLGAPVDLKAVSALSGRPDGSDPIDAGSIEVSGNGVDFESVAKFAGGKASATLDRKGIVALRIRPTTDANRPLTVREITLDSTPPVAAFVHPIEFRIVVDEAPEMKDWAEGTVRICEAWYPRLVEELKSEGDKPVREVTLILTTKYDGVAMAGGGEITGSVEYFKAHPKDRGAFIHETVHIIQHYHGRGNPGWLVEGVADYIRFFEYEPENIGPINAERARYNDSYRTSARFIAYLVEKYDPGLVRKLNAAMREGKYKSQMFKDLTGKDLKELGEEWRASLKR